MKARTALPALAAVVLAALSDAAGPAAQTAGTSIALKDAALPIRLDRPPDGQGGWRATACR